MRVFTGHWRRGLGLGTQLLFQAALHLAFTAQGIKRKDLGVVPAIALAATENDLVGSGAEPYFFDTDSDTGISVAVHFEEAVNELSSQGRRAKVYVPVSFIGEVANLEAIEPLASKNGAYVVEDVDYSLELPVSESKAVPAPIPMQRY